MNFNPKEIVRVLAAHDVDYILIGGVAAAAHGSPYPTVDIDICPLDEDDNLRRLAAALEELGARLMVTGEEPIALGLNPRVLRATNFLNFVTDHGVLDIVWRPAATRGYEDLRRGSVEVEIGEATIRMAGLIDIIRSKSAELRDKDMQTLHVLRELAERKEDDPS